MALTGNRTCAFQPARGDNKNDFSRMLLSPLESLRQWGNLEILPSLPLLFLLNSLPSIYFLTSSSSSLSSNLPPLPTLSPLLFPFLPPLNSLSPFASSHFSPFNFFLSPPLPSPSLPFSLTSPPFLSYPPISLSLPCLSLFFKFP